MQTHPADQATINGHPTLDLLNGDRQPVVVTVCAGCGSLRSVLWFNKDRWYCRVCRAEGATPPNYFPVA